MNKRFALVTLALCLTAPIAKADMFGGDVAVLTQILAEALQQLSQLEQMVSTANDNLHLMQDVYRGLNDVLNTMPTLGPDSDPGLYREWLSATAAMKRLQEIYGEVPASKDAQSQKDADQSAAEAIKLNNDIYKYSESIDELGEEVKAASHDASPVGAAKLTVQTLGIMLHVLNQSLRTQATELKLQAQSLALQNKKEKATTENLMTQSKGLESALRAKKRFFDLPNFE